MQVVILAGGMGSRISEETQDKPKPLVDIGGMPIILHVIKIYQSFGFTNFLISTGYKSWMLNDFFLKLKYIYNDIEINDEHIKILKKKNVGKLNIKLINTGINTNTAGRLSELKEHLENKFFFSYSDTLANIHLGKVLQKYEDIKSLNKNLISIVSPTSRWGLIKIDKKKNKVTSFLEKPKLKDNWINIGYGILQKEIIDYIDSKQQSLEQDILPKLANKNLLYYYLHDGDFYAMDSLRDKIFLNELYQKNKAFWKNWKN